MRERLWLWLVVHIGTRQSSPRQFFRFYLLMGIGWLLATALGVYGLSAGADDSALFVAITATVFVVSVALCATAAADLRSPSTVEGRVISKKTVDGKGIHVDATGLTRQYAEDHGYYSHRVTLADDGGDRRTFRGAVHTLAHICEGDFVRARVGMRLRWIYNVDVVEDQPAS